MTKYNRYNQQVPQSIIALELPENELKLVGIMTSEYLNISSDFRKMGWMPLSKAFLFRIFNNEYIKVLNGLLEKGVISERLFKSGRSYSVNAGICRHYQFTKIYYNELATSQFVTIIGKHPIKRAKKVCTAATNPETPKDKKDPLSALFYLYDDITLGDEWQDKLWNENAANSNGKCFFADLNWSRQIASGDITVSEGESGRLFHPAIMMRKELREFVLYKGKKLAIIDVVACHPHLMGEWAIAEEKESWLEICKNDIYLNFVTESISRETVKKAFQRAISFCRRGKDELALNILEFIGKAAPSILSRLEAIWANCKANGKKGNCPQALLQEIEARIFVKGSFKPLSKKFFCLPLHDGLAIEPKNLKKALRHVAKVSKEILGYELPMEAKI